MKWFREKRNELEVSERLASLGDEFEKESLALASLFKYLAVIHGTGDSEKMARVAEFGNCLATLALDQFDERERSSTEQMEHLIQEGTEIIYGLMYDRNWSVAQEAMTKVAFLDDLLKKVKSGEVVPKDSWPDVVGDVNG